MSDRSAIEWTDASWNPLRARNRKTGKLGWHCVHTSEGCRFCYAETRNRNTYFGNGLEYKPTADVEIILDEKTLLQPMHWRKPRKIFVGSMTDLFGDWVTDEQLDRIFAVMALCPQHTFQVLTKRAERMRTYMHRLAAMMAGDFETFLQSDIAQATRDVSRAAGHPLPGNAVLEWCDNSKNARENPGVVRRTVGFPPYNIWLGVSCEDQATADERIPLLLDTPAAVRFISAEPLLGEINLCDITDRSALAPSIGEHHFSALPDPDDELGAAYLDWVIAGGESGAHARPMHPDWARSLRDQCRAAGVAFFFKQFGEWAPGEAFGLLSDEPISNRHGDVREWMDRYVMTGDRGDRVRAHSFTKHATDLVYRVGKKRAGRLLDGVEHSEFPSRASA